MDELLFLVVEDNNGFQIRYKSLRMYEGHTAFWIENIMTKEECCMGDMVDSVSNKEITMDVGSPGFYVCLAQSLVLDYGLFMECYFPDFKEV